MAIGALTGELSIGGEPLDWSKVSGSPDIALTLKADEKKTGWQLENGQWVYHEVPDEQEILKALPPLENHKYLEIGYLWRMKTVTG